MVSKDDRAAVTFHLLPPPPLSFEYHDFSVKRMNPSSPFLLFEIQLNDSGGMVNGK